MLAHIQSRMCGLRQRTTQTGTGCKRGALDQGPGLGAVGVHSKFSQEGGLTSHEADIPPRL